LLKLIASTPTCFQAKNRRGGTALEINKVNYIIGHQPHK
jgi:hypothetical protein